MSSKKESYPSALTPEIAKAVEASVIDVLHSNEGNNLPIPDLGRLISNAALFAAESARVSPEDRDHALNVILALHRPQTTLLRRTPVCVPCNDTYPCATVRIINHAGVTR